MTSIALVTASGRVDGIIFGGLTFHRALQDLDYGVTWYQCVDYGAGMPLPQPDQLVHGLGFPNQTVDMGVNRLWIFPRRLRNVPEDVVFLMDPTLVNVARFHRRSVVRLHDLKPLTPYADRRASTWMFRYAIPRLSLTQRILVPTSSMASEVVTNGVPADLVRVVPETHLLGVHPDHIQSSYDRILATGEVRVLCVSTDRPYKNLALVIRLAQAAVQNGGKPRLHFTLVSRLGRQTQDLVSRLRLPNLTVIPEVGSIAEVYEANDVLLHPSLHEGFGRPLIEAMAFGLPVVATNVAPFTEIVGDSGVLLDPASFPDWLQTLNRLLDPSHYREAARRSFARGDSYSPAVFRSAVQRALQDL